jgi:cell division protein FtsB|tara:strand:- start:550 stop:849 length:300 start_codon:yes stop_codon:yes gene_type:complete
MSVKNIYRYLYISIFLTFVFWMAFLDTNSFKIHRELNQELEKLEEQKKALIDIIDDDKRSLQQLNDKDSLEHYARENYGHKKEDETIFYIEFEDGLNLK